MVLVLRGSGRRPGSLIFKGGNERSERAASPMNKTVGSIKNEFSSQHYKYMKFRISILLTQKRMFDATQFEKTVYVLTASRIFETS